MKIDISRAKREDALEFYNLEARCFEMKGGDTDTLYYWVPILSYQCCYKAIDSDSSSRIVGGVVSMPTFDGYWYINSLFVDPKYRRSGIAGRLMQRVLDVAAYRDMMLDVKTDRPHLVRFYNGFGFEIERLSSDHYYDDSDRFIMKRIASKT